MPSKKKKYNARFPPARIKKIMQTDDEVGKVAAAVPVIISRALELFVESLIKKANDVTQARNAKTLTTTHLKQCILAENKFDFLKDLVATVPDVQAEDDTSNSGTMGSSAMCPAAAAGSAHPVRRHSRARKPRSARNSVNNNAGPSHSGAEGSDDDDDEEEDEDEDGEDEDSESSGTQGMKQVQPTVEVPANIMFQPTSFPVTMVPHQVPTLYGSIAPSAINQDDDDYDS